MHTPWESPMWEGKVAVSFGYPSDGWVMMAVLCDAFLQSVVVLCSDVFSPFDDMVDWLRSIQADRLPARWVIEEEGYRRHFIVERWEPDPTFVVLKVEEDPWFKEQNRSEDPISLRTRVPRTQLINEFASRFARWLREGYDILGFGYRCKEDMEDGYGFDLRTTNLEGLDTTVHSSCSDQLPD